MIDWYQIKKIAVFTETGKMCQLDGEITSSWKKRILLAEHSPIRAQKITIHLKGILSYVSTHLVRHKIGVEHFVHTARPDRGGKPREEQLKVDPVNHVMIANLQAIISMSRKRLCKKSEEETRQAWQSVVDDFWQIEPELASVCVPECVYRGFCPEMKSCGFCKTEEYKKQLEEYRSVK